MECYDEIEKCEERGSGNLELLYLVLSLRQTFEVLCAVYVYNFIL